MDAAGKARCKTEFGDFQTPRELAALVAARVAETGFAPASIIEPTCGVGNMLIAAVDAFPGFTRALGVEAQQGYLDPLTRRLDGRGDRDRMAVWHANFFEHDWRSALAALPDPMLVIGNPPWVTNAQLGAIGGRNLPVKTNFQGHSGLDALTGKSNFDISEAILMKILGWLRHRHAVLAMLCKTAVARKILAFAWQHEMRVADASICRIDSDNWFGAAVDACIFICRLGGPAGTAGCPDYPSAHSRTPTQTIAYRAGRMLADVEAFDRWRHLEGAEVYRWRSGVKHDCAEAAELLLEDGQLRTKAGFAVDIEPDLLFPMLKASDLANGRMDASRRRMLVTQRAVGDDTKNIARTAPKTWAYLLQNTERFDRRASAIYKDRPPFAMFGVGEYSFAPWKVAIAGLYKTLEFRVVGPRFGKPVVLDDTCYFLGCQEEGEARLIASILNSKPAREFYRAFIFWDAKRPVTVDVLRRLDLRKAAAELGESATFERYQHQKPAIAMAAGSLWPE